MRREAHDKTAYRGDRSIDTRLMPKFLIVYRVVPACLKSSELVVPVVTGMGGDAPTPNPSPLIGLRRSTLRRESNA